MKNGSWLLAVGYVAVLTVFSLMPFRGGAAHVIPHFDKLLHLVAYFILVILLYRALLPMHRSCSPLLSAFLFAVAFGILIEFLQLTLTNYRTFSIADMGANLIGSFLGILACRWGQKSEGRGQRT